MDTTRQNKIARLIQKELANMFLYDSKNLYGGAMITVTKVVVTKDLTLARAYLSLYTDHNKAELLKLIHSRHREIRGHLGHLLRNQLRIIPALEFYIDDSLDYIDNIDRLLHPST